MFIFLGINSHKRVDAEAHLRRIYNRRTARPDGCSLCWRVRHYTQACIPKVSIMPTVCVVPTLNSSSIHRMAELIPTYRVVLLGVLNNAWPRTLVRGVTGSGLPLRGSHWTREGFPCFSSYRPEKTQHLLTLTGRFLPTFLLIHC